MKHLTPEQLSALTDGALNGRALEEAERHLGACAECRTALEALGAQDQSLRRALTHDPGEPYFATFADRVENRIRAESLGGAQRRGAEERPRAGRPASITWLGAVAAVVVAVGVAFLTTREMRMTPLRDQKALERAERESRAAPPAEEKSKEALAPQATRNPGAKQETGGPANFARPAPEDRAGSTPAPGAAPSRADGARGVGAPPIASGRAQEVRRDERGEDVPVSPAIGPWRYAVPPPAPTTQATPGEPVMVVKRAPAVPMQAQDRSTPVDNLSRAPAPPGAAAPSGSGARAPASKMTARGGEEAAIVELCGDVLDHSGRPVANAQVVLAEVGAAASTDARGRFCLPAPAGERTLSVMAVGFVPALQTVQVAGGAPRMRVTLQAVSVLGTGAITPQPGLGWTSQGGPAGEIRTPNPLAPPSDAFTGLPDSLRATARDALLLTTTATRLKSAASWEAAADQWSRLIAGAPGGAAEAEARFQLASARFQAWRISPTAERRAAATGALGDYLARAPAGPRREQARAWWQTIGASSGPTDR